MPSEKHHDFSSASCHFVSAPPLQTIHHHSCFHPSVRNDSWNSSTMPVHASSPFSLQFVCWQCPFIVWQDCSFFIPIAPHFNTLYAAKVLITSQFFICIPFSFTLSMKWRKALRLTRFFKRVSVIRTGIITLPQYFFRLRQLEFIYATVTYYVWQEKKFSRVLHTQPPLITGRVHRSPEKTQRFRRQSLSHSDCWRFANDLCPTNKCNQIAESVFVITHRELNSICASWVESWLFSCTTGKLAEDKWTF